MSLLNFLWGFTLSWCWAIQSKKLSVLSSGRQWKKNTRKKLIPHVQTLPEYGMTKQSLQKASEKTFLRKCDRKYLWENVICAFVSCQQRLFEVKASLNSYESNLELYARVVNLHNNMCLSTVADTKMKVQKEIPTARRMKIQRFPLFLFKLLCLIVTF